MFLFTPARPESFSDFVLISNFYGIPIKLELDLSFLRQEKEKRLLL